MGYEQRRTQANNEWQSRLCDPYRALNEAGTVTDWGPKWQDYVAANIHILSNVTLNWLAEERGIYGWLKELATMQLLENAMGLEEHDD